LEKAGTSRPGNLTRACLRLGQNCTVSKQLLADTSQHNIRAYSVSSSNALSGGSVFATATNDAKFFRLRLN
jgi:hypothetical protein